MRSLLASLAVIALANLAFAEALPVSNGSFEAPTLDPGGWSNDLPDTGWTQLPENGSAFIEYIDGFSADGNQHLGMAEGAEVYQDLGVALSPNSTYTLTVSAGNRNANFTPAEGQVSSFAFYLGDAAANGGTLLAASTFDAGTLGESSYSDDLSVSYSTGDSVAAGNLFISLASTGAGRAHFDNVRVDVVPEPTAGVLAIVGCLAILRVRRRR